MPPEKTTTCTYGVLSVGWALSLVLNTEIYLNSEIDPRSLVVLSPSFHKGGN